MTRVTYVPAISLKGASIKKINQFLLHILVNVAVASKGFTAFLVTAEGTDEIRVLDFLIEITDEGASCEVTACDFVEWAFLLRTCCRIENSHHAVHFTYSEKLLDSYVVFLRTDEREQFSFQIIASGVFLYQSLCPCVEREEHGRLEDALLWSFAAYILWLR